MKHAIVALSAALLLVGCNTSTEEAADAVAQRVGEAQTGLQETAAASLDALKGKLNEQVSGLEGQLDEVKKLAEKANNEEVNSLIQEAETKILSIKERATEFASAPDPKKLATELGAEVEEVKGLFARIKEMLGKLIPGR